MSEAPAVDSLSHFHDFRRRAVGRVPLRELQLPVVEVASALEAGVAASPVHRRVVGLERFGQRRQVDGVARRPGGPDLESLCAPRGVGRGEAVRRERVGALLPVLGERQHQLPLPGKPGDPGSVDEPLPVRPALDGEHPPRALVGGPLVGRVGERGARLRSEGEPDPARGELSSLGWRDDQVFGGRRWRSLRCRRGGSGGRAVRAPAAPGEQAQRQGEGDDSDPVRQGVAGRAALLPSVCLAATRTCRESLPDALPRLVGTAWNAGFGRHRGQKGRGRFVATPGGLARATEPSGRTRSVSPPALWRAVPAEAGVPNGPRHPGASASRPDPILREQVSGVER